MIQKQRAYDTKTLSKRHSYNRIIYSYEFIAIGFVLKIQSPKNGFRTY
jgi:hypothetical protein